MNVKSSALTLDSASTWMSRLPDDRPTREMVELTELIQKAARRQGSSVSQFVREAALMRARMATDDNPYPMRALAEELRAIGDQGYALAEKALKVAEDEAERKR